MKKRSIIFLHGWGVSSEVMQPLASLFRQKGWKTFTPDFPGFGKESEPKTPWNIDDYAQWFNHYRKKKKLKTFVLFAHSFGGRVAIKFAIQHPDTVQQLILCGAAGLRPQFTLKSAVLLAGAKVGKLAPKKLRNAAQKQFSHLDYFKVDGVMRKTLKNVVQENLRPSLKKIPPPTLLIWGEDDQMTPLRDAYIMEKEIPLATLATLRDEGHTVYRTNPRRVYNEIEKFLKP